MKKISILSLHLGYGGIERCVTSLANLLCQRYEVEIAVCYKLYEECVFDLDKRVKVIYLNDKEIIPNKEALKQAIKNKKVYQTVKDVIK